jgi:hypothetical protein
MSNGSNEQSKQTCVGEVECETALVAGFVWPPCAVITFQ